MEKQEAMGQDDREALQRLRKGWNQLSLEITVKMELKEIAGSLGKTQIPRLPSQLCTARAVATHHGSLEDSNLFSTEDPTGGGFPDGAVLRAEFPTKSWNISKYVFIGGRASEFYFKPLLQEPWKPDIHPRDDRKQFDQPKKKT